MHKKDTKDKQFHMRLSNTELRMWKAAANELGYTNLSEMLRDAVNELQTPNGKKRHQQKGIVR